MLKIRSWMVLSALALTLASQTNALQAGVKVCADLLTDLNRFESFIQNELQDHPFTASGCEQDLHSLFESIRVSDSARYALNDLKNDAPRLIKKSWEIRLKLRAWLRDQPTPVSLGCLKAVRNIYRAGRFVEDYLVDRSIQPQLPEKVSVFQGGFPLTLSGLSGHESFNWKTDLKSGDVLLSRGEAVTSAAIARIGDIDAQFSHAALVYVDPTTRKIYTIEAHIEYGVIVAPIEKYFSDGKVRSALFRQSDPVLGAKAAKWMFDHTRAHLKKHRENIHYDFTLNLKDHRDVFCSEVITMAYEAASGGEFFVPQVQSRLDELAKTSFLKDLGVTAIESFLPGDLEMDTRFELVAEWRNHMKMRETHHKDAVLTKMYEWMGTQGYAFDPGFKAGVLAKYLIHTARNLPFIGWLLKDKFPGYMPRKTLETIVVLDQTGEPILRALQAKDQAHFVQKGQWMTIAELYQALEAIRAEDSEFHQTFHP